MAVKKVLKSLKTDILSVEKAKARSLIIKRCLREIRRQEKRKTNQIKIKVKQIKYRRLKQC